DLVAHRVVHDRIAISENDGADSAHPVDVLISIDVPEPRPFGPRGVHRRHAAREARGPAADKLRSPRNQFLRPAIKFHRPAHARSSVWLGHQWVPNGGTLRVPSAPDWNSGLSSSTHVRGKTSTRMILHGDSQTEVKPSPSLLARRVSMNNPGYRYACVPQLLLLSKRSVDHIQLHVAVNRHERQPPETAACNPADGTRSVPATIAITMIPRAARSL